MDDEIDISFREYLLNIEHQYPEYYSVIGQSLFYGISTALMKIVIGDYE